MSFDVGGLLECPHCGSTAEYVSEHAKGKRWAVACTMTSKVAADECKPMCRCRTPFFRDKGQARDVWNRRVAVTDHDFAMAVHDGRTWVCVEAAMESDALKPIPGFTRDSIYRDSMQEYGEWMEKAKDLMRDLFEFMSTPSWCEERCELTAECDGQIYEVDCLMRGAFAKRLRKFGIEVDDER